MIRSDSCWSPETLIGSFGLRTEINAAIEIEDKRSEPAYCFQLPINNYLTNRKSQEPKDDIIMGKPREISPSNCDISSIGVRQGSLGGRLFEGGGFSWAPKILTFGSSDPQVKILHFPSALPTVPEKALESYNIRI